ncbi:MAG: ATP-binding cassette domain-containing protein, partial [Xanthobacteraceae bacterium]
MILKLDNLARSFGSLRAVDGVALEVARGEALGIIGPNGAGKSTLFNLITGLLKPDTGTVHFDGHD